ncbi:MAG: hypothetical protein KDB74_13445, partial [Flavobacteriales bacterium]|nr:hypothetical protein [Flavobacteriales bacterium]
SLRTFTKKRYRYVGKEKDQESGLYYYGARYYAAWTCRFISVDPLAGKYAMLTPYNNASNSPIKSLDIDGMQNPEQSESEQTGKILNGPSEDSSATKINVDLLPKADLKSINTETFDKRSFDALKQDYETSVQTKGVDCIKAGCSGTNAILGESNSESTVDKLGNKLIDDGKAEKAGTFYASDESGKEVTGYQLNLSNSTRKAVPIKGDVPDRFLEGKNDVAANIIQNVNDAGENGFSVYLVSVGAGFHTMTIVYDNTNSNGQFYLMDQGTNYSPRDSNGKFEPIDGEKLNGYLENVLINASVYYKTMITIGENGKFQSGAAMQTNLYKLKPY